METTGNLQADRSGDENMTNPTIYKNKTFRVTAYLPDGTEQVTLQD